MVTTDTSAMLQAGHIQAGMHNLDCCTSHQGFLLCMVVQSVYRLLSRLGSRNTLASPGEL